MARPTDYTEELVGILCSRIATGTSLRKVCKADDMPSIAAVYNWFPKYPEFVEQYARAKEDSGDADQDRLDEIAERLLDKDDELDVQAARVAADIIKWSAGKKRPKKYGDKTMIEDVTPIPTPEKRKGRISELLNKAGL